jgi:gamma-glutamylcyclotransferase (GGCT)/AIG2-like uncharacterized protein YtfP
MDRPVNAFFVYGTLKKEQLRGTLWPRPPQNVTLGIIRATLYDLGPYPGAVPGDDWILGELWQFSPEDMQPTTEVLDRIEGYESLGLNNEYVREHVAVWVQNTDPDTGGQRTEIDAFAYFVANPSRIAVARKMHAERQFLGQPVAVWPDSKSRVPKSFAEE